MQKNSTSLTGERRCEKQTTVMRPKKTTVDLIKQFARAYAFSAMMPAGLGHFVAN